MIKRPCSIAEMSESDLIAKITGFVAEAANLAVHFHIITGRPCSIVHAFTAAIRLPRFGYGWGVNCSSAGGVPEKSTQRMESQPRCGPRSVCHSTKSHGSA